MSQEVVLPRSYSVWNGLATELSGFGLSSKRALPFCVLAILILIPLASAPVLTDYRVADDFRLVGDIDFPAAFRYFGETTGFGRNEWRPLVPLSFALDNSVWESRAVGYHLSNVLLHTLASVLLLLVVNKITGNLTLAFFAAALFGIHPVNHSRVAWIAAREGPLSMVFLMISLLGYVSARQLQTSPVTDKAGPIPNRNRVRVYQIISCFAYALALASYEGASMFPVVLLGFEILLVPRPTERKHKIAATALAVAPYFMILVLYIGWWIFLFNGKIGGYDLDLSIHGLFRDFYRLHYRLFHHIQHWLGLLYLVVAVLIGRQWKQRRQLILFSVLLIWIGYLPFLPLNGFADRFAYFSCTGAVLLLGIGVTGALTIGRRLALGPILALSLSLILVGYYEYSTIERFRSWVEAGRISEVIPAQLKALRPSFPPNSTLVFEQIPTRHGEAHLFSNSFRVAVREKYPHPIPRIYYYPTAIDSGLRQQLLRERPAFHFRYLQERETLVEIGARSPVVTNPAQ
jgi:hypothetical protein